MQDYHKLQVWQKSHGLGLGMYRATATFPKGELFSLTSQISHAVSSIARDLGFLPTTTADALLAQITEGAFQKCLRALPCSREPARGLRQACRFNGIREQARGYNTTFQTRSKVKRVLAALIRKLQADR